jgi:hypothetical protein
MFALAGQDQLRSHELRVTRQASDLKAQIGSQLATVDTACLDLRTLAETGVRAIGLDVAHGRRGHAKVSVDDSRDDATSAAVMVRTGTRLNIYVQTSRAKGHSRHRERDDSRQGQVEAISTPPRP